MGRPVVSSWGAVNPTVQPGGAPQITVQFTPASDNKNLWFRFDLRQNPGSWIEGDWVQVNKTAGAVTLTYTRGGVQGIPSDWGGNKQVRLDAQLVWGEGGRGSGQLIGRKPTLFNIASAAGDTSTPAIVSLTPVSQFIPVGGPAEATVVYNSGIDCYLKLDLRGEGGIANWTENSNPGWQHAPAGQNKSMVLRFNNVPANWKPSEGINKIAAQVVWSGSGSGRGNMIYRDTPIWTIVEEDEEVVDQEGKVIIPSKTQYKQEEEGYTKQKKIIDGDHVEPGPNNTNKGDAGTTTENGILAWLKQNWLPVALIGFFLLLAVPGRSSKDN